MSAKILVVEDDSDIRINMKRLLESEGYAVDLAENGQVALEALTTSNDLPSLIILDLMMPVMDGFQFRAEQCKSNRIADIPIVIMSADGHTDEKKRKIGAKAALRKPADIDAILRVVQQLCR